jgi:YegS/Rv2252/BmrU family lipid kinase
MAQITDTRLLFVINTGAGSGTQHLVALITNYFSSLHCTIYLLHFSKVDLPIIIQEKINSFLPQKVIAVGGDGTVTLVAAYILHTNISLGIIPVGSSNGLAKELGISTNIAEALDTIVNGAFTTMHVTIINKQLCLHLSDIGLNAFAIKQFQTQASRGLWGYCVASLKALWQSQQMKVSLQMNNQRITVKAVIIVIANATTFGTGAVINPIGKLDDAFFEVIVVKAISLLEVYKMLISHAPFNTAKTEIFQTSELIMGSSKKVHFQIDGEYYGKVKVVAATLIPKAIHIMVTKPLL